jgi:transposase
MAPTLTKKAGGALKLSFPFEKITKKKKVKKTKPKVIMGVDLGLKVWAMISIVKGLDIIKQEDYLSKDDFNKLFEGVDIGKHEVARYFLDQEELTGKASDWWKNSKGSRPFFNFKRKLMYLMRKAKELKSQLDNYKKKHKNYRNKKQFFITKREWQRVWLRINHIHKEIAKQLAARIVQLALFHGVTLIRFENLKWSSHSPKEEVGYWLSTWQTHWFFSEIIRSVSALASRSGIRFELVNARNTSQRCSKCGRIGTRKGKTFFCHHCKSPSGSPRQLGSDLNAARNITITPLPLSHRRKRKPPVLGTP